METSLTSIISQNGATGLVSISMLVLVWLCYKMWKERGDDRTQYTKIIEADQKSREALTQALTALGASVAQWNSQNGNNQEHCETIRVCLTSQVDRLTLMEELDKRLRQQEDALAKLLGVKNERPNS